MNQTHVEFALKRWAEKEEIEYDEIRHEDITDYEYNFMLDDSYVVGTNIDHAFFAELPMDGHVSKGMFLDYLCKLVGYDMGFTDNTDHYDAPCCPHKTGMALIRS